MSRFFNDSPIETANDDQYGILPFARAIAKSIQDISAPIGTTIAINGAWGAGKSSAINLIRNELDAQSGSKLSILDFKCWWYRGEEALTLAFFQELNSTLKVTLGEKFKNLIPALGKHMLQAGPVLGAAVSFAPGGGLLGPLVSGGADFTKRFFPEEDPLEKTFAKLSKVLQEQQQRFLVIIDDIDRLSADEALAIFRLVKSAGRLPNVMYLLVFDRELADAAVQQRYPSEGPHFLEKIIQASFELPSPIQTDLNNALLAGVERICGPVADIEIVRFMNVFYDAVAPFLLTPRHVTRLINAMTVTWAAVNNEIDKADFVALETLRLYEPKLYNAIKLSKEIVTGSTGFNRQDYRNEARFNRFIEQLDPTHRDTARVVLLRLFPALEEVIYDGGFTRQWDAARRVCVGKHFDTYFRLSLSEEAIPTKELQEIIDKADDIEFVKGAFRGASHRLRKSGKTMVPVLLDELTSHARQIEKDKVTPFLAGVFAIVDEISHDQDSEKGFSFGNTPLRVHWLMRRLTEDRFSIEERTTLYQAALGRASLDWLVDFVDSAVCDYVKRDGEPANNPHEKCLVSPDAIADLKQRALARLREAATGGALIQSNNLFSNIYRWREFSDDNGTEMKAWLSEAMKEDAALIAIAKALTSESWSQGMGGFSGGLNDRVAKRNIRATLPGDTELFDQALFKAGLERIVREKQHSEEDVHAVQVFLDALESRSRDHD